MPHFSSHIPLGIALALLLAATQVPAQAPRIDISGGNEALRNNVRSHLRITEEPCGASQARLRRFLPQIRENIQNASRALGYYQSRASVDFSEGEGCWRLNIELEPGQPVLIRDVELEVVGSPELDELFGGVAAAHGLVPGVQLHHGAYEAAKDELAALAVEQGYFSARFRSSQIRLDLNANRADIVIEFEPGERFSFGEIRIDSGEALDESFIRRMLPLSSGDPYTSDALVRLRDNLDRSRYFQQISLQPQLAQASGREVPLNIGLSMRPRNAWSAGVGFTTDTGPRLRLDYENRYLNRRGHQFNADAALSPVRSQANLQYRIPLSDPVSESLDFGAGFISEDTASFDSERVVLEAAYRNESEQGWSRNVFVNHQQDDYALGNERDQRLLTMLGFNLGRTRADDLIYPTQGYRVFAEIRGGADQLLSDVSFLQLYASAKGVLRVNDRSRFLLRLEGGSTWVEDIRELPVSARFFAGGDRSIRGFDYQALGPLGADGELIGGKHLLVGSVEFDYSFRDNWLVALFVDSGNAYSDPGSFRREDSFGIGVRWLSPIGPLRADIAHAPGSESSVRLHVTMGPDL